MSIFEEYGAFKYSRTANLYRASDVEINLNDIEGVLLLVNPERINHETLLSNAPASVAQLDARPTGD